jgi:hypothetical protein
MGSIEVRPGFGRALRSSHFVVQAPGWAKLGRWPALPRAGPVSDAAVLGRGPDAHDGRRLMVGALGEEAWMCGTNPPGAAGSASFRCTIEEPNRPQEPTVALVVGRGTGSTYTAEGLASPMAFPWLGPGDRVSDTSAGESARRAEPGADAKAAHASDRTHLIVGIGASAGGIEAFRAFFARGPYALALHQPTTTGDKSREL